MKVALFGTHSYDKESFENENKKFGLDIIYFEDHLQLQNVALAAGFDVVCIFVNDKLDAELIKQLSFYDVRMIALRCSGYNNVDLVAARQYNIKVVNVPAYSPHAVAEYALAMMLSLNRKIYKAYWRTRDGNFSLHGLMGFDMYKKTVGVIGTGVIGKSMIQVLAGFGMQILAYDVYPDLKFAEGYQVRYVSLDQLYSESDIITLHCPLTKDNRYMINKESIKKMKAGVMLINTGRGPLINSEDLIEGLKTNQIGFAGLDVYEEEADYFYEDESDRIIKDDVLARLMSFTNVILTSHQGYFTKEAVFSIARITLQNICGFMNGGVLQNEVKA